MKSRLVYLLILSFLFCKGFGHGISNAHQHSTRQATSQDIKAKGRYALIGLQGHVALVETNLFDDDNDDDNDDILIRKKAPSPQTDILEKSLKQFCFSQPIPKNPLFLNQHFYPSFPKKYLLLRMLKI